MQRLLDDGLDELAAHAHQGVGLRMVVTLGVAGLVTLMLPRETAAAWAVAVVLGEVWAWFATRRQSRGEPASPAIRLAHVGSLVAVNTAWMTLGALLWLTGTGDGIASAAAIWLAVIFFAQSHAYQSRMGFVVGGVVPALGMMTLVTLAPNRLGMHHGPVLGMFALGLLFAADGAKRMMGARARFDAAQAELRRSEAHYRVLADNVTDVIALSGVDGERLYISPSIEQALGYSAEELLTTPSYAYLFEEDRPKLLVEIAELTAKGGEMTTQYRVICRDGRVIWVETNFTMVQSHDAAADARMVTVSRNIEARKALENELVEARRRAEEAAAVKSDFLANMTHELRTPLNAIIGFSGVLRASRDLNPKDARHAGLIADASATLLELVNSVLDFSRLEAGAVEIEAAPFDPAVPARAMGALLADQAEAKGLSLEVRIEGEITPLVGDAGRIRQVLLNFLSNAIKFTPQGQVTLTVRQTDAGEGRDRLRMEVADTGIGVSTQQIDNLFERFTQADVSVSRQYGGTGLGLAICKRTVELMGGTLGVDSAPGQGSTFWFELILPRSQAAPAPEAVRAPQALDTPIRLLLVEDVAVNRELVSTLLGGFSIEIEMAEHGLQAIAALERSRFDLVLMDVQMPVMDGLTATAAIRARPEPWARTTPIIAMTANVMPEQIQKCLDAGMDDHLGKPISPAALLQALADWTAPERADERADEKARAPG